jgi:beta-lactamase regulating signal transducer with metallopeptidase domain
MKTDLAGFSDQILSGSINGIYQGVILAAMVALGFRIISRKTNAATRHAILFFTLLLLASLMIAHWGRSLSLTRKISSAKPASGGHFQQEEHFADTLNTAAPDTQTELLVEISSFVQSEVLEIPNIYSSIRRSSEPVDNSSNAEILSPAFGEHRQTELKQFQTKLSELLRSVVNGLVNPVNLGFQIPRKLSILLLTIWIAAVACKLLVLLLRLNEIRRLKTKSAVPNRELKLLFDKLCQTTSSRRTVRLRVSQTYKSPLLLGFLHPVILLPAQNKEHSDVAELEQVLRHELAHVRRYDDWANLVQHLLHAILFFHPAVWWISKRLTLEREIACDDEVLEQTERRSYALLLVDLARRMQGYHPTLAPGTFSNKNQLKERIDMVLDAYRNTSPHLAKTRMGIVTASIVLFAAGAICYAPRVVLAQNDPVPPPPGRPPAPAEPFRSPTDQPGVAPAPRNLGEPFSVAQNPYPAPQGQRPPLGDLPPVPGPQPAIPPGPRGPMMRDMSPGERPLEQRLARVERMLEMLMSHFDLNPAEAQFHGNNPVELRERAMRTEKFLRQREFDDAARQFNKQFESQPRDEQGRLQDPKALKQEMQRQSQFRTQNHLLKLQQHLETLEREKAKVGQEIERLQKEQKKREPEANKSEDKE